MMDVTSNNSGYVPRLLSPEQGLKEEMELLDLVASNQLQCGYKIWCCEQSIVVPKSFTRKPGFDRAVLEMHKRGWPVVIRHTGGDLVPQSPGLLNVSLVFKQKKHKGSIKYTYEALCSPLISALKNLGIDASCSAIPGSFCDGDYNLVVNGQKIAGTAQRWKRITPSENMDEFAVLVHAVILCGKELHKLWRVTNDFYAQCSVEQYVEFTKHISVSELVNTKLYNKNITEELTKYISQELDKYLV